MNKLNALMLWFAQLTDDPDYGYIDNIYFSSADFLYLSILICTFLMIIHSKQYKTVVLFLLLSSCWLITNMCFSYQQEQEKELVIFYVKQKPNFLLRIGTEIYASLDSLSAKEHERYVKPYLLSLHHYHVVTVQVSQIKQKSFTLSLAFQDEVPIDHTTSSCILVSNDTRLNSADLYKNKPLVVADCSNSYTFVKQLKQQCALVGVPFYSVKEHGALRLKL